ncbi:hypothetical protein PLESTF_001100000 [Pleodorina starrii]|nr:hypothetical protein PLESTF_001100000 [Pleodorina starrii]
MSPVRPRRAFPVESELSTPGSDGYASPSVLFVIRPSSMMRSSVQNPLYVDRPTPSDGDNVAKALVLSPCADRSPASRLPRQTFESGWSSPSSAEQSISLNPSQHDDRLSPLPHLEATSSPGVSSMRQAIPSLSRMDLETPRRIIKNLSMPHDAIAGVDLAAAARATSPRGQRAELGLPTPCSAALPLGVGQMAVPAIAGNAADSSSKAAVDTAASSPRLGKSAAEQPGSAKADNVNGGHTFLDLDDTIVAGRTLDQTPRKAARAATQSGEQERHVAVKGAHKKQRAEPKLAQQLPMCQRGLELGQQRAMRSSGWLRTFVSWVLLPLVMVVLAGSLFSSVERLTPVPSVAVMAGYKTGPVCFREQYPGANSVLPSTRSTRLSTVVSTPGVVSASSEPSGIIAHVDLSAAAADVMTIAERPEVTSFAPDVQLSSGVADAEERLPIAPNSAISQLGFGDADAVGQLPIVSALAPVQLGPGDAIAVGQLPSASGYPSPPAENDMHAGHISAPEMGTGAEPVVQELAQPSEQTAASIDTSAIILDGDFAADMTTAAAERPEQYPDVPPSWDNFAPEQDALDADSPSLRDEPAVEQLAEVAAAPDSFALRDLTAEAPAGDTDSHTRPDISEVAEGAVQAAEDDVPADSAPGFPSGMPTCEAPPVASVEAAEEFVTADSTPYFAAYGTLPEASSDPTDVEDGSLAASDTVHWLFAARMYGWTLPEFLLGVIGACLAGGLLAWTVEFLGSHTQRRPRANKLDGSVVRATLQPSPSPEAPAGRILRLKWPQGADASAMEDQVASDIVSMQAPYNDNAQHEQATGSLVWTGNKLVYFEG